MSGISGAEYMQINYADNDPYSGAEAVVMIWDSVATLIESSKSAIEEFCSTPSGPAKSSCGSEFNVTSSGWIGRTFSNWDDCWEKSNSAWDAGISILEDMKMQIEDAVSISPINIRRRRARSEFGGDGVDMERLYCGQPYWDTREKQRSNSLQTVKIIAELGANCGMDSQDIMWRGAAAAVIADLLEENGFRVEIWGAEFINSPFKTTKDTKYYTWKKPENSDNKYPDLFYLVNLKESNTPVDMATLATGVSGWFFRTAILSGMCDSAKEFGLYPTCGLGRCVGLNNSVFKAGTRQQKAFLPFINTVLGNDDVIILNDFYNKNTAVAKAQAVIKKFA